MCRRDRERGEDGVAGFEEPTRTGEKSCVTKDQKTEVRRV